jgi:hypothetical protein
VVYPTKSNLQDKLFIPNLQFCQQYSIVSIHNHIPRNHKGIKKLNEKDKLKQNYDLASQKWYLAPMFHMSSWFRYWSANRIWAREQGLAHNGRTYGRIGLNYPVLHVSSQLRTRWVPRLLSQNPYKMSNSCLRCLASSILPSLNGFPPRLGTYVTPTHSSNYPSDC